MGAHASIDLRKRVVDAYLAGGATYEEVAERFSVGRASVSRWLGIYRRTEGVEPRAHGGGMPPKVDAEGLRLLRQLVEQRPDATLKELAQAYQDKRAVKLAVSIVCRALARLGLTRKKRRSTRRSASAKMSGCCAGTTRTRKSR